MCVCFSRKKKCIGLYLSFLYWFCSFVLIVKIFLTTTFLCGSPKKKKNHAAQSNVSFYAFSFQILQRLDLVSQVIPSKQNTLLPKPNKSLTSWCLFFFLRIQKGAIPCVLTVFHCEIFFCESSLCIAQTGGFFFLSL